MTDLLSTINSIRTGTGQPVVNPILAAALNGATEISVDAENQRAAEKQAAADPRIKLQDNGDDTVNVKNMPKSDFIATAAQSGSKRLQDLKTLLQPASEAAKVHELVQSHGFNTEDPNDPKLLSGEQTSGYRGMYRSSREIGNDPIISAVYGLLGKAHLLDPKTQAADLQNERASRDVRIAKSVLPLDEMALRERTQTRLEGTAASERTRKQESTARQLINGTDLRTYPDDQTAIDDIAKQSEMDTLNPALAARVTQKRKQDVEKYAKDRFDALRTQNKSHIPAGQLETMATDFMGRKPTTTEMGILKADQEGEAEARKRAEDAQVRADQRLERYINGKPEKPHKLYTWEAENASPDALIKSKDDPSIDQDSLKRAIDARIGQLEKEYSDLYAQSVANTAKYNDLKKYTKTPLGAADMSAQRELYNRQSVGAGIAQRAKTIEADLGKFGVAYRKNDDNKPKTAEEYLNKAKK